MLTHPNPSFHGQSGTSIPASADDLLPPLAFRELVRALARRAARELASQPAIIMPTAREPG